MRRKSSARGVGFAHDAPCTTEDCKKFERALSAFFAIKMLSIATNVLTPFSLQTNTGNCYEFYTALYILRCMGLTDADHTALKPLVASIALMNNRSAAKINKIFDAILTKPVGSGAYYKGIAIVDMRNVTQDDNDGGTGDLVIVLADGQEKSISICEGTKKRDGNIEKCISNPTCKRFGCDDADVERFKTIQKSAVVAYKAEMTTKYGVNEASWPSRVITTAACDATSSVASITGVKFNALLDQQKLSIMKGLLCVTDSTSKPADILCLVKTSCKSHCFFEIKGLAPGCRWAPRLVVDGYWLNMYLGDAYIGRTQVKFNNGVYHKGKTSSLTSSWNATAVMNKVFDLAPITL